MSSDGKQISTHAALIPAVLFWGLSFVATKIGLETFPIFTLVFDRFSLASLLFLILMCKVGFPKISPGDRAGVFVTALQMGGGALVLFALCLTNRPRPRRPRRGLCRPVFTPSGRGNAD
jgi:drug/metabolite transporter (DMT)-like permease